MNRTMSMVAGVVLIGLGAFVLLRGADVTTRRDVMTMGDVKITADEKQAIPPWAAGVVVAGGVVLLAAGARKRA
jgi:hypothetical protein